MMSHHSSGVPTIITKSLIYMVLSSIYKLYSILTIVCLTMYCWERCYIYTIPNIITTETHVKLLASKQAHMPIHLRECK